MQPPTPPAVSADVQRTDLDFLRDAFLLALIVFTSWFYGTVESRGQLIAHFFLCVLAGLHSWQVFANPRRKWINCPFGWLLWGLLLLTLAQIVPLPEFAVRLASPARAAFEGELLPAQPEVVTAGAPAIPRSAMAISVCAYDTRSFAFKLLFIGILYSIVRNAVGTRSLLRKLAYVCLVNAALLSVAGFAQKISPHPERILWSPDVTASNPFGPFINRNHFAFYANLCLGLGFAVLSLDTTEKSRRYKVSSQSKKSSSERLLGSLGNLVAILQNPRSFWVLALGLVTIAAIVLTQSRGGYLALAGGAIACFAVWSRQATGPKKISWGILLPFCVGLSAILWFSSAYLESKITQVGAESYDDRTPLWHDAARLVPQFLVAGTGGGTFALVEPLHRESQGGPEFVYDHAHNEYLESLVEGGFLRLALALAIAGLALRAGYRACRVHEKRSSRGFAYGCLFAIATAVIHSVVEFGVHIGAIAILLTVIAAATLSLAQDFHREAKVRAGTDSRFMAVFSAIAFPALAVLLNWQAWKVDIASQYQRAAERERDREPTPESVERRLAFSRAALAAQPDSPELLLLGGDCLADAARLPDLSPAEKADRIHSALEHWIASRNRSILLPQPHERIGVYRSYLNQGDPAATYFERAKRLLPIDPQIWYACGESYFESGNYPKAVENWRRALELGTSFWRTILEAALTKLPPERIAAELVPDDLKSLMTYMNHLYPDKKTQAAARRPFLAKAVGLLSASNRKLDAESNHLEAQLNWELGHDAEAAASFQAALAQSPSKVDWRVEYGRMLRLTGNFEEAAKQLKRAHDDEPANPTAQYWLLHVEREIELRK